MLADGVEPLRRIEDRRVSATKIMTVYTTPFTMITTIGELSFDQSWTPRNMPYSQNARKYEGSEHGPKTSRGSESRQER